MCQSDCDTNLKLSKTQSLLNFQPITKTVIQSVSAQEIKELAKICVWMSNFPSYNHPWTFVKLWRTVVCGWYSNIPVCCIIFFVLVWSPLFYFNSFSLVKKFLDRWPPGKPFYYVACPFCVLFNKRKKSKVCEYSCTGCCLYKENP